MTIGIDARMLGSEHGGLGRYVEQLVRHLPLREYTHQYVVFLKRSNWDRIQETDRIHKVLADIPWYGWQEQIRFGAIIKKEKVDLMHFPHWNVPLLHTKPFVVTIHDLIMYHYPRQEASTRGPAVYWMKDMIHRLVVKHAVKKARHIFVTSEWTKNDVHQTLGVPLEKMTVTYQAPCANLNVKTQMSNQMENSKSILEKFGISKPYVLYVGTAYPHKNLQRLVEAWRVFEEKHGLRSTDNRLQTVDRSLSAVDYQLVLAGRDNFFYQKLKSSHLSVFKSFSIIHTGFVNDEQLAELYQNATLYVFPSLYEGFGLPPLEAMSCGVPVASSDASCLPEVLGEAAIYFDPKNIQQMADVIFRGLTNEDMRSLLRENGKQQVSLYSASRMAEKTLAGYQAAGM